VGECLKSKSYLQGKAGQGKARQGFMEISIKNETKQPKQLNFTREKS